MMKSLKKLFLVDDRTGLPSNTKLVRMVTFMVAIAWVLFCVGMIIWSVSGNVVPPESEKFIDSISNLIIFLFGGAETSYQMNRTSKLKNGNAPLSEPEEDDEDPFNPKSVTKVSI